MQAVSSSELSRRSQSYSYPPCSHGLRLKDMLKAEEPHEGRHDGKAWRLQCFQGNRRVEACRCQFPSSEHDAFIQVAKRGLCMTQTGTPYYASPEVWRDMPYDAAGPI